MERGAKTPRFGGGNKSSDVFQASFSKEPVDSFNPNDELTEQPSISNEEYTMKSNSTNAQNNANMTPEEELAALRRQVEELRAVNERLGGAKPAEAHVPEEESSVIGTIGKVALWTLGAGALAAAGVFGYQYFSGKEDTVVDALAGAADAIA